MGYDFNISYKKGKKNKVMDALSIRGEAVEEEEELMTMLSFSSLDWVDELLASYKDSMEIQELLKKEKDNSTLPKGYKRQNGLLLKKGRMVVLD